MRAAVGQDGHAEISASRWVVAWFDPGANSSLSASEIADADMWLPRDHYEMEVDEVEVDKAEEDAVRERERANGLKRRFDEANVIASEEIGYVQPSTC